MNRNESICIRQYKLPWRKALIIYTAICISTPWNVLERKNLKGKENTEYRELLHEESELLEWETF